MQAELITIGDEILIGQTIDTNSAWMGQKLNEVGVEVHRIHSIRDTSEAIVQTLDGLHTDTQLVLITGGLGPTKDDLTKHTLTRYFGGQLQFDQEVFAHIQSLFQQMGRDISHLNRDQAELPSNAFIWKKHHPAGLRTILRKYLRRWGHNRSSIVTPIPSDFPSFAKSRSTLLYASSRYIMF